MFEQKVIKVINRIRKLKFIFIKPGVKHGVNHKLT